MTLREAILQGFRQAGWLEPTESVVTEIEFAVNNWLAEQTRKEIEARQ